MLNWITQDLLTENAPKLVGALIALAAAHSSWLKAHGVNLDWGTIQGELTTGAIMLIGMLAGHHTAKAVTGGSNASAS